MSDVYSMANDPLMSSYWRGRYNDVKPKFASEADWYANYGIDPAGLRPGSRLGDPEYQFSRDLFTQLFGAYQPPAPLQPVAQPQQPAQPQQQQQQPTAEQQPATEEKKPDAISAGGAVDQPGSESIGDQLGGAVLNPPKYWIGGIDSYNKAKNTGGTQGAITTTQT